MENYSDELEVIENQIENVRNKLNKLIEKNQQNLLHKEILELSELLDQLLLKYDQLKNKL
jgi:hypothetical protein